MSSKSESGHAKNAANFETFIDILISFGGLYAPSRAALKIIALQAQLVGVKDSMDKFKTAHKAFKNASNDREVAFDVLDKLTTRIANAFASTEALKQKVDDLRHYVDKMRGGKKKPKNPDTPPEVQGGNGTGEEEGKKKKSTSQLSFDSKVDHFDNMLKILVTEPLYVPNEPDLTTAALTAVLNNLKARNKAANQAETNMDGARKVRNKALYGDKTGVYDIVKDVKTYMLGVKSKSSAEYKQLTALKFTDMDIDE